MVLDFDATNIPLHGMQEGRHWHSHCHSCCRLPLYVFAGRRLLAAVLQTSNRDRAGAVLALLARALRTEWPGVEIIFPGDGGFRRARIMRWCERSGVGYVLGLSSNSRLAALVEPAVGGRHRDLNLPPSPPSRCADTGSGGALAPTAPTGSTIAANSVRQASQHVNPAPADTPSSE